ncbi:hypothetical protein GCM10010277_80080 [Streptomyces longisporoflavus]|uniref:hypothetical protein n=1 Tax=Streptomyces longisporoflavus TaxID=28044 RepID=UPI0019C581EE|nr:hypothetical protein [Streptomyces longisporoflavus]GGV69766.1 hypothetical protein GCM10010277_80080 [Streptomyces longisporoflavus]
MHDTEIPRPRAPLPGINKPRHADLTKTAVPLPKAHVVNTLFAHVAAACQYDIRKPETWSDLTARQARCLLLLQAPGQDDNSSYRIRRPRASRSPVTGPPPPHERTFPHPSARAPACPADPLPRVAERRTSMTFTMDEVLEFIGRLPDASEVSKVQEACAQRLSAIDEESFTGLVSGRRARINQSLRPAVLRSLTGTVQGRNRTGRRAGFLLDEKSTRSLRRDPRNGAPGKPRYRVPEDTTRFRLPGGIPVACLDEIEDD